MVDYSKVCVCNSYYQSCVCCSRPDIMSIPPANGLWAGEYYRQQLNVDHHCLLCYASTERLKYGKYNIKNRFSFRYFGTFEVIYDYHNTYICEDHYGQLCSANVDPPCPYLVYEMLDCEFCDEKTEHDHKKYIGNHSDKCLTHIYDIGSYLSAVPRDILNIIKQYVVYNY